MHSYSQQCSRPPFHALVTARSSCSLHICCSCLPPASHVRITRALDVSLPAITDPCGVHQAQSGMLLMASLRSSRPSQEYRLCASRTSWSATSPSNWAMPMPRCTAAKTSNALGKLDTPALSFYSKLAMLSLLHCICMGQTCHISFVLVSFSWIGC